jgi:hypothetical protein
MCCTLLGMLGWEEFESLVERVVYLDDNLRLLAAREVYDGLEAQVLSDQILSEDKEKILERWTLSEERFETIVARSEEIRKIIRDCSETLDGWTLGSELFGISTYYRVEEDGLLSLRMEGVQEIPIFEQLAVLYEVSLFNQWMPFCSHSELLQQICESCLPACLSLSLSLLKFSLSLSRSSGRDGLVCEDHHTCGSARYGGPRLRR